MNDIAILQNNPVCCVICVVTHSEQDELTLYDLILNIKP